MKIKKLSIGDLKLFIHEMGWVDEEDDQIIFGYTRKLIQENFIFILLCLFE